MTGVVDRTEFRNGHAGDWRFKAYFYPKNRNYGFGEGQKGSAVQKMDWKLGRKKIPNDILNGQVLVLNLVNLRQEPSSTYQCPARLSLPLFIEQHKHAFQQRGRGMGVGVPVCVRVLTRVHVVCRVVWSV